MTPETFAKAIASIDRNYGLRLDARSGFLISLCLNLAWIRFQIPFFNQS